jgi:hypothetical protein
MATKVAASADVKAINRDGDGHELREPKLETLLGEIVNAPIEAHDLKFDKPVVETAKTEKKESEQTIDAKYIAACQQYSARPNANVLLKIRNNTICVSGKIDVSYNFLGDIGACALFQIIAKYPVTSLVVAKNGLRNNSIKVLAEALRKNSAIKSLDLSANDISLLAAIELQALLRENKIITEINLKKTKIDDVNLKRIEALLELNKKKI